jgi:replication factor A1
MKVSELNAGQGKIDVTVTVKSMEEPRTFNKFGRELKVANAVVSDESGEIKMSLWNDDIEKVKVGDTVKIENGYVSEFQGEKQLTAGKFGSMEVVGKGDSEGSSDSEDAGDIDSSAGEGEEVKEEGSEGGDGSDSGEGEEKKEEASSEEVAM